MYKRFIYFLIFILFDWKSWTRVVNSECQWTLKTEANKQIKQQHARGANNPYGR